MPRSSCCSVIILALALMGTMPADRTAADLPAARIERALARHRVPKARIGVAVRRLKDGNEFFTQHPTDLFEMASNTKLFTTAVALRELGADYEFSTAVIANGPIADGKLEGDLVIVGGGDPSISGRSHNGDAMAVPLAIAKAVKEAGIVESTGDLVMDDRLFDRELRAPGWPGEEHIWWYAAPVCALSFNDNCIDVRVEGGVSSRDAPSIKVTPISDFVQVLNQCKTITSKKGEGVTFVRSGEHDLKIGGRIRMRVARTESLAVERPALYLAKAIETALATEGFTRRGKNRRVRDDEKAAPEAREVFVWRSKLTEAVNVANRRSQNFYAEQILKTLGATKYGVGSFASGARVVHEHVKKLGFPDRTVLLADGSGLSPGNRATPQAVAALLEIMYRGKLRDVYLNSLAVNGGALTTLRRRLTEPAAAGRIHAKTGTIKTRGISALSGYAQAVDGEVYAFSILTNGFNSGHLYKVRAMENAVCRALLGVPTK